MTDVLPEFDRKSWRDVFAILGPTVGVVVIGTLTETSLLFGVAALLAVTAVVAPLRAVVAQAVRRASRFFGRIVGWATTAFVLYVVISPIALFARLRRRDPYTLPESDARAPAAAGSALFPRDVLVTPNDFDDPW